MEDSSGGKEHDVGTVVSREVAFQVVRLPARQVIIENVLHRPGVVDDGL